MSRREELLDVLVDHVQAHGLEDSSVRRLAEAAGVAHNTLTHYFGSRTQLLADVFGRINERTAPMTALAAGVSQEERLRNTWLTMTSAEFHDVWSTFYEVLGAALREPDVHREFLIHVSTDWSVPLMTDLVEAGMPAGQAAASATFVVATFRGLVIDALAGGDPERINGAFELLIALAGDLTS